MTKGVPTNLKQSIRLDDMETKVAVNRKDRDKRSRDEVELSQSNESEQPDDPRHMLAVS